jgi:phosphate transport system permease protein
MIDLTDGSLTRKRYAAERRFKLMGLGAVVLTGLFLAFLIIDIVIKALPTFTVYELVLPVTVDAARVDPANPSAGD